MKIWKAAAIGLGVVAVGATAAFAYYRQAVDQPPYRLIEKSGDVELREYAPMIVAEVTHTGDRRPALNAGFRRLAAYIFAEDRPGEEIAMTAPVLQDGGDATGQWRTRFVMPAKYTMETLPTPPEDITLVEMPTRRVAAIRFSGNGNSADLAEKGGALREWLAQKDLTASGPAEFAFYDAPMVPPPLRRNEVMIPVE